ncbi:D-alanyl-D-alanine carboxypeptidase family protein [Nesterenkonia salmonea]|uniref:D-alanyl-D-alanine carboxypeptidase family protein n=1 Tax=Nesterenkonia salmonea TaxID=1804987 RepID=A0A5R9BB41_9MICC|nr:M15 family metallopeptidase [Nesterenkonia salmonea]TLP95767.1 D-alanyl-D-alanine carboxypeptidase family protein [Nesterenkonia salmonea]
MSGIAGQVLAVGAVVLSPFPSPETFQASQVSWDPDSVHVLVNRQNPLEPVDYSPEDLVEVGVRTSVEHPVYMRAEPAEAVEELFDDALEDGVSLAVTSGYRPFDSQTRIYSARHAHHGTEGTDEFAARPGYSEHQTGLAVDVISIDNPDCIMGDCFHETPEFEWLEDSAHDYGFIIRYPEGMEHVTGFAYEPWHLRYVGEGTAEEVVELGLTLEEYWRQPAAPDYDDPEPDPEHLDP